MLVNELKEYIFKNEKIEYVLEQEKDVYKLLTFEELFADFKKKIPTYAKKQRESLIKDPTEILILNLLKYVEI